jgi:hypothetical protein
MPKYESLRHKQSDEPQHLPSLPFELRSSGSSLEADLSTFNFLGEGFVKQFLMVDGKEYSIIYRGYLLLNYAYSLALTGHGTKMELLKLKGQPICHVNENIKSSNGVLSPQCLTAIMALGGPVVCLVSQDLSSGRSLLDYIDGDLPDEYLCCRPESADTGKRALNEQKVHCQPTHKLFSMSSASYKDADSIALLHYLSNHISMSVSLRSTI